MRKIRGENTGKIWNGRMQVQGHAMEMNFNKLCGDVAGPDLANPSEYRQLIGALIFIVKTRSEVLQ